MGPVHIKEQGGREGIFNKEIRRMGPVDIFKQGGREGKKDGRETKEETDRENGI